MAPGEAIGLRDLPPHVRGDGADRPRGVWDADYPSLRAARIAFEKHFIEKKLAELDGNVSRTAQVLDLERSNLYRKMRAYGIEVERDPEAS
jgi:two-component system nitrogen regulation response regulator NtrX